MKVSIVIRSYNEARHIGKLLLGISVQTLVPSEIILVDSGSTDGTIAVAEKFDVKIIRIDKREFTFGRALNVGCEAATGDILVFASAHVFPTRRSWLSELVKPLEDKRVVLSYGKQRGDEVNRYSERQIFKAWFPERSICPQLSYFCNNANCAVRRSAWLEQPYDETLTGLEDLDWAKKAQTKGEWIAYTSRAEIIHVHTETWRGVRNRYRREAMSLRRIDKSAHFGTIDFVRTLMTNCFSDLVHAMHDKKLQEAGSILAFRFNQFLGTYQGHNGPEEVTAELRKIFYFPHSVKSLDEEPLSWAEHEVIDYERLQSSIAPTASPSHSRRLTVVGSAVQGSKIPSSES